MKKILVALLVLILLAVAGVGGAFWYAQKAVTTPHASADATPKEFIVKKGASARSLGQQLQAQGFLDDARVWRFHLWRRGSLNVKAGRFMLSPTSSVEQLATALEGPPLPEDVPFAMIEGWRLRDTDQVLAAQGLIKPGEYIAAASRSELFKAPFPLPTRGLEGYLYPETYGIVVEGFKVEAFIQRQLETFRARFYDAHKAEIDKSGRSLHDIVVMASMLEREEPMPSQRPLVAGILWKRVDKGFALGVDATSRYELAEWNDRKEFLKRLRDKSDPWNSRTRVGLPPGPIGAPTVDSLLAALRPTKSDFLYYLHDAQRILRPSRNAQEHEALRAKYNVY
ncbi:endolytic transglycosylase MltG [Corallococcus terminator]|uniref:Endolytic murein transglycosylase n=1 Tax=Corallococcus terminator TaxID=2316733 RepID=A0A3A8J8Z9_9BACT|nr:endolytic transglycosylase MltG [Corallococcus terminator]RKG91346.1 endolytic transglycosylase MltG [Corallococcus terminator]